MKLSREIEILYKLRKYAPLTVCVSVYYLLFYSYITYVSIGWSNTFEYNTKNLNKLQKKCEHFLTHTNPLFSNLNLLKVKEIMNFAYDFISNNLPGALNFPFTKCNIIHSHNIRGSFNYILHIPSYNSMHYVNWS